METIRIGRDVTMTYEEAQRMIEAYCFSARTVSKRGGRAVSRARWGYLTYDCLPRSEGEDLEPLDLLVASGLGGDINVERMASLLVVADEASRALSAAHVVFWEVPEDDLIDKPPEHSPARPIWDAWEILMSVPDVDVAIAHKILHHKRPKHFPLLDGETTKLLPRRQAWVTIHRDIQQEEFARLEGWFAKLATSNGTIGNLRAVPLYRLRLHDILLWGSRDPQRETLQGKQEGWLA